MKMEEPRWRLNLSRRKERTPRSSFIISKKLWKEDYMKMLLDVYDPKYKYTEPNDVSKASKMYIDSNNDVKKFINEHFELTNKKEDYVLLKDIKATYSSNKNSGFQNA